MIRINNENGEPSCIKGNLTEILNDISNVAFYTKQTLMDKLPEDTAKKVIYCAFKLGLDSNGENPDDVDSTDNLIEILKIIEDAGEKN